MPILEDVEINPLAQTPSNMDVAGSNGVGHFLVVICQSLGDALGVSPQAVSSTLV